MLESVLFPIVSKINEYLSNYILIFLLVGVGLWYSIKTRFVQVRCFGEGMKKFFGRKAVILPFRFSVSLHRIHGEIGNLFFVERSDGDKGGICIVHPLIPHEDPEFGFFGLLFTYSIISCGLATINSFHWDILFFIPSND